jgi:hypothetical protein
MEDATRWFTPASTVRAVSVDETVVLVDHKSGQYFGLNETGAQVWKCLEQGKRLPEIVDAIALEYTGERETIVAGVQKVLAQMSDAGVIQ